MAVCSKKQIKFRTRRGKTISFTGRPGGTAQCGKKARKKSAWSRKFGQIGRACAKVGKPGTARNISCLRSKFKADR